MHPGGRHWIARQPAPREVVPRREIDEDGITIGDRDFAILYYGNLAERIVPGNKIRRLVSTPYHVDGNQLSGKPEQRQKQLDAMRVPRQRVAMETNRALRCVRHGLCDRS